MQKIHVYNKNWPQSYYEKKPSSFLADNKPQYLVKKKYLANYL